MKKILSVLIALLLVFTFLPKNEVSAAAFSDVPTTHTYYQEIMFLLDKGVINSSSKYGVNDKVTREEVAVMVSKAVGLDGKQTTTKFKDVPSSLSSSGYINSAVNAGIINGYPDGTFKPKALVTRGHMATFISRGFELTQEANVNFKDVPIGSTSYEHVRKLAFKNITTGYPDGTFKPNENLSRSHISAFIARAMGYGSSEKETYTTKEIVEMNDSKIVLIETDNGQGSGIVVSNGLILTNHHVIDGATSATVTFNSGERYVVQGVIESDAIKDIAIIKTTTIFKTSGVSIRTSSKGLSKGEKVVAIGSPRGLQNTVSEGIISSFRISNGVSEIQTNADIDHGSSGGALFDESAQLIGMTSSGYDDASANLNFAVATEEFVPMVNKYINKDFNSINSSFPTEQPTQPVLIPVLGDIALGMTKDQVGYLAGGEFSHETVNGFLFSNVNVLGYLADVSYEFEMNKLIAINVYHYAADNQSGLTALEDFFLVMYEEAVRVYGGEDMLDIDWYDDEDGYALSAYWVTADHDLLLRVKMTMDYNTFGGIRISIL